MNREKWKNLSLYCIYPRNHSETGTFQSIIDDLPRIVQMGFDFVWLLPIHPIGKTNRKGTLGSPYSIDDFRQINPEYGTLNDFRRLLSEVHRYGMGLMIDIVFRHTSHDCAWVKEHPQWYLTDTTGKPIALVPEWTDILDLKFEGNEDTLWKELIEILQYWCDIGVDGFRMDVASAVPIQFWHQARDTLARTYPNVVWLAESTRWPYIERRRAKHEVAHSDSTLYQVFDICYDYDLYGPWRATIAGALPIKTYVELLRLQSVIYPEDYIKLRFVENHDQQRVSHIFRENRYKTLAWTAFSALNRGCFLVHAGQETEQTKVSSLFEKDWIDCKKTYSLGAFIQKLIEVKKHPLLQGTQSKFTITHYSPCIVLIWESEQTQEGLICLFNVEQNDHSEASLHLPGLPRGDYRNLLSDFSISHISQDHFPSTITVVTDEQIPLPTIASVLHYSNLLLHPSTFHSDIFDFDYRGM